MMARWLVGFVPALLAIFLLAGCDDPESVTSVDPENPGRQAVGHYCGMIVVDHPGPKGQIFVEGRVDPYWFSSVRDAIAFTLLPEEPKRITGFYVNDAATIGDWNTPDMGSWIGAEKATYVIGSSRRGGMGAAEAVPFQDGKAAEQFASQFGGRVVSLAEIPRDYILGDAGIDNSGSQAPGSDQTSMNHMHKP